MTQRVSVAEQFHFDRTFLSNVSLSLNEHPRRLIAILKFKEHDFEDTHHGLARERSMRLVREVERDGLRGIRRRFSHQLKHLLALPAESDSCSGSEPNQTEQCSHNETTN